MKIINYNAMLMRSARLLQTPCFIYPSCNNLRGKLSDKLEYKFKYVFMCRASSFTFHFEHFKVSRWWNLVLSLRWQAFFLDRNFFINWHDILCNLNYLLEVFSSFVRDISKNLYPKTSAFLHLWQKITFSDMVINCLLSHCFDILIKQVIELTWLLK